MTIDNYLQNLNTRYKTGISREHSYRGDLQALLEELTEDVLVTNEPARIQCGAPDYILTKKNIPLGYIEAKDIGADLGSKQYKEQFNRYKESLNNLIITDYLDFWLFRDGELATQISIGQIVDGHIESNPEKHEEFKRLIKDFSIHVDQTITRRLTKRSPGFELTDEENGIGRVWINDEQYFDQVPKKAFEFYIGGYQPAEKWLKDRRDRTLSYEDILHYQKIIKALMETDRLMQEIDAVDLEGM